MSSLFVNQLTTIDFSYLCPERGLVGETWLVDVILSGELNEEGMVFDFGHVKKEIKAMIDSSADHALLVPALHPAIQVEELADKQRSVRLNINSGNEIICQAPEQAIMSLPVSEITPENVRPLLEEHVLKQLPDNVTGIEFSLYPDTIQGAYFHYSHGLKKHSGDCQRIAHGHRSPLKVFICGEEREELAQEQAKSWRDIYLATTEDLQSRYQHNGQQHLTFAYTANQGDFLLSIPESHCYLLETDTTIELLADHLAQCMLDKTGSENIKVIANEGFCKGAIGIR
ncbi:6-pyruvoyl trahydropterin synthase family protein [Parendozoicomonas haliclonae]|uniref:6-carboxy-5,6,7,8-tetrahydropterin synthase n=1 Tax=Parendozoicomonas haliclonae TaxID=1960125 RepID=A0A1X7AF87_9GAMM|nr:6-carboxytetrahydropterin synthase [Parendozoicomonas haliclonae]SMA34933.1 6-pyruvoyl tetrahydropterin synthase [Parendozoicomonas haliclonae]